jgi:hypothetical protein
VLLVAVALLLRLLGLGGLAWEFVKGGFNAIGTAVTEEGLRLGNANDAGARNSCAGAETHWQSVEKIDKLELYQDHLARFPTCNFAALAKERIKVLDALSHYEKF